MCRKGDEEDREEVHTSSLNCAEAAGKTLGVRALSRQRKELDANLIDLTFTSGIEHRFKMLFKLTDQLARERQLLGIQSERERSKVS